MINRKFLIVSLFLLVACKPQVEGFDNTSYDLYKESQFANEFALIKDDYGKSLDSRHDEKNYIDGIMKASVMFGEMDLSAIKKQVIARMDNPDIENDEEGIWRPLYDGIRRSHGHAYHLIDAWVYWFIFNPQIDKTQMETKGDSLINIAVTTAMSRANVAYWHKKTIACIKTKMTLQEMQTLHETWPDKTKECMRDYINIINDMASEIYQKLKILPQYRKGER